MTRRIVDLKDVNTQELVYPATHSDAVLMPDGKTVTEAIANAGGGGAVPVVWLSNVYGELDIQPNKMTRISDSSSIIFNFIDATDNDMWFLELESDVEDVTFPDSTIWANDNIPTLGDGKVYQISISKGRYEIDGVINYYAQYSSFTR